MKRVLIIRSGPYQVNISEYNLQEIGLSKALIKNGYSCDVMYYHRSDNFNEVYESDGIQIKILWRHGVRLLRSGIYPEMLKNEINNYDYIICSEYSQIMSVLTCKLSKVPVFIYNGPYYNLFKIPFIEPIYDLLFCKFINRTAQKVFCKTKMAEKYITKKGLKNTRVIGVGLDTSKFNDNIAINKYTKEIVSKMKGRKNILYIGQIIPRKNVALTIKVFCEIAKIFPSAQLVIIGKGENKYTNYCKRLLVDEDVNSVIWIDHLENAQLKYIYKAADIFLLPSNLEIFGMVLLEAMYFGLPVVSSRSAGADTLIQSGVSGVIIDEFDPSQWYNALKNLIEDEKYCMKLGKEAKETIEGQYIWDKIAAKIVEEF